MCASCIVSCTCVCSHCFAGDTLTVGLITLPDQTARCLIVKKFKDSEADLDVGRHWIDETVVLRVSGSVELHEDQWIAPTVSIPLIPTIAFFWERIGVEKDEMDHGFRAP